MIGSEIIIEGMIFYGSLSLIIVVEIIVYIDDIKSE